MVGHQPLWNLWGLDIPFSYFLSTFPFSLLPSFLAYSAPISSVSSSIFPYPTLSDLLCSPGSPKTHKISVSVLWELSFQALWPLLVKTLVAGYSANSHPLGTHYNPLYLQKFHAKIRKYSAKVGVKVYHIHIYSLVEIQTTKDR